MSLGYRGTLSSERIRPIRSIQNGGVPPGPGIMYVLTRGFASGRREGMLSLGTFIGGFVPVIAADLQYRQFAIPLPLYQAVRWAGAAYRVYLGIRMIKSAGGDGEPAAGEGNAGDPQFQNRADILVALFAGPIGKRLLASRQSQRISAGLVAQRW